MDLLTVDSLPVLSAFMFLEEATKGRIWVPKDVSGDIAKMLERSMDCIAADQRLDLHIDTNNGTATVWSLAEAIKARTLTRAHVGAEALSAGLILTCACAHRICLPDTRFLYHGFPGQDEANARKAKWFAERTNLPEETWLAMAETGEAHEFGAEQALEWGVVHSVEGGRE